MTNFLKKFFHNNKDSIGDNVRDNIDDNVSEIVDDKSKYLSDYEMIAELIITYRKQREQLDDARNELVNAAKKLNNTPCSKNKEFYELAKLNVSSLRTALSGTKLLLELEIFNSVEDVPIEELL